MNNLNSELKKNNFIQLLLNNRFILLSFAGSVLISILVAFCYNLIPFGNSTILRMDLYHQYGPLFAELYERIKHGDGLIYSWISGGGSSFLGNFYNYLSSPMTIIVFLFGHENITEAISTMIFAKACLASATFTYYLKKSVKKHDMTTAAFGILYAFSGYFLAYYWNLMWLDAMLLLPILLYGIERIIDKGKVSTYIITLIIVMISNYYMSYMACIFSVIYFLFYYFSKYPANAKLHDFRLPSKQGKFYNSRFFYSFRSSRFLNSGFSFAVSSALAGAVCAFSLVTTYFILQSCSATSGTFPRELTFYNTIFDFLANHLAAVEPTIRSSGENVLPNVFCGIITVMLVPLFYFAKSISIREKVAYTCLLGVLLLSFNTNYLNYIWHGFHFPNDLPYRFSFMYSFIILIMAYKTFIRLHEFKSKEIMGVGFGTVLFIILVEEITSKNVDEASIFTSLAFAIIYTIVFYFFSSNKYKTQAISVFLLCCVISEYAIASTDSYTMNQLKSSYASDLPAFEEAKKQADKDAGNTYYRMELTDLRTRMDPCWYYYNGISTFSSMAYERLSNLQQDLGLFGNYINSYTYNMQTPVYNAMFALDYIFNNSDNVIMNKDLFREVFGNDDFTSYRNNYSLPIAYMTNSNLTKWEHTSSNPFEVQSSFFEMSSGVSDVFERLNVDDVSTVNLSSIENYDGFNSFFFDVLDTESDSSITILVTPKKTQNLYLYVESSAIDELTVQVNGREIKQSIDGEYYILDLGLCNKDETLTIDLPVSKEDSSGYADFHLYGLNMDKFIEGYEVLKKGSLKIDKFESTKITGTFKADKNGLLYTSIPYDEGWKVTIDGKEVQSIDKISLGNALLAIYVGKGEHIVEFKYTPKGMNISIIISIIGLFVLILYLLISKKEFMKKRFISFCPKQDTVFAKKISNRIFSEKIHLEEITRKKREQEESNDRINSFDTDDDINSEKE